MSTISDRKIPVGSTITHFLPDVDTYQDYFPFGMVMSERSGSEMSAGYRFGFNGKELDQPGLGGGLSTYDYGFRIYNPAIAKFLSVDPLTESFPWYTPYQFAGNKPITAVDLDGLEEMDFRSWFNWLLFGPNGAPGATPPPNSDEIIVRVQTTDPARKVIKDYTEFAKDPGSYIVDNHCDACAEWDPKAKQVARGGVNIVIGVGITVAGGSTAAEGNIGGVAAMFYGLTQASAGLVQVFDGIYRDGGNAPESNGPLGIIGELASRNTGDPIYAEIGMLADGTTGIIITLGQNSVPLISSGQEVMKSIKNGTIDWNLVLSSAELAGDVEDLRSSFEGTVGIIQITRTNEEK